MRGIDVLVNEHDNIIEFCGVIRNACLSILEGGPVDTGDFRDMVGFIRGYCDAHHHGKEEDILFAEMLIHLGNVGKNLVTHGMMVEHDLARMYVSELEKATLLYDENPNTENKLDIIGFSMSYADLLGRHADKENKLVYPYGQSHLGIEVLESINHRTDEFELAANAEGAIDEYLNTLNRLKIKYERA